MFFSESAFERIREAVFIALDQLRANKFRSAMTILGIVIGVATVMVMGAAIASLLDGGGGAGSAMAPGSSSWPMSARRHSLARRWSAWRRACGHLRKRTGRAAR